MIVQHNISAMNANRSLNITTENQAKSTEKLTTGYKINRAADDSSGLAISEKMREQIRGLDQASANAQDGISMVQTAEGALEQVHSMLQRMNELAISAANGVKTTADVEKIGTEITSLNNEITRIAASTEFNKKKLLNGSLNISLQIGTTVSAQNRLNVKVSTALTAAKLGTSVTVSTVASAKKMVSLVDKAIEKVSVQRSALGDIQNRLGYTIKNLDNISENTQAAEAAIRDTNMAEEMVKYSNNNILAQAGQSMLAQANQKNQGVLSLLG